MPIPDAAGGRRSGDDGDVAQVIEAPQTTGDADHVARLRHLQRSGPGLAVGALHGLHQIGEGQLVGAQHLGVDDHLVLLDHAADGGDLGDPGQGLEFVLEEPVLEAAQLGQVMAAGAVHQGVLIDPADGGGVRAKLGAGRGGQAGGSPG